MPVSCLRTVIARRRATFVCPSQRFASVCGFGQKEALVLGNSPAIVRKYHAQWSKGRQDRVSEMMADLGPETPNSGFSEGTKKAQTQNEAVN
jgi:hypothetical protein